MSAALRAYGADITTRLLGARISLFGSNEDGAILLGAVCPDGSAVEIILFVEDGELMLAETEPQKDTAL